MAKDSWSSLSVKEKIQYSLATMFGVASIIIGFVSFIILMTIPASVIGISALWASVCCGVLGISLHFRNEMIQFDTEVKDKLNHIDNVISKLKDK